MAKPTKKSNQPKRAVKKTLNASAMKRVKGGDESPKETLTLGFKSSPQIKYVAQLPTLRP